MIDVSHDNPVFGYRTCEECGFSTLPSIIDSEYYGKPLRQVEYRCLPCQRYSVKSYNLRTLPYVRFVESYLAMADSDFAAWGWIRSNAQKD